MPDDSDLDTGQIEPTAARADFREGQADVIGSVVPEADLVRSANLCDDRLLPPICITDRVFTPQVNRSPSRATANTDGVHDAEGP